MCWVSFSRSPGKYRPTFIFPINDQFFHLNAQMDFVTQSTESTGDDNDFHFSHMTVLT
jgi:hypothetical protein